MRAIVVLQEGDSLRIWAVATATDARRMRGRVSVVSREI
jgi:hypothetical protein